MTGRRGGASKEGGRLHLEGRGSVCKDVVSLLKAGSVAAAAHLAGGLLGKESQVSKRIGAG